MKRKNRKRRNAGTVRNRVNNVSLTRLFSNARIPATPTPGSSTAEVLAPSNPGWRQCVDDVCLYIVEISGACVLRVASSKSRVAAATTSGTQEAERLAGLGVGCVGVALTLGAGG